jgi:hypothetical protein
MCIAVRKATQADAETLSSLNSDVQASFVTHEFSDFPPF